MVTLILIIELNNKIDLILLFKCILYISHPIWFKKKLNQNLILLNSSSKINIIILNYIAKLDLKIQLINIGASKINSSFFKTFEIILASF